MPLSRRLKYIAIIGLMTIVGSVKLAWAELRS